jgi:hypothetical protein
MSSTNLKDLTEGQLRTDRQNLARALHDIDRGEAAGLPEGEREAMKEALIRRIAELDRLLGLKED